MSDFRLTFIPGYLEDQVLNKKTLSTYDDNDLDTMNITMLRTLLGTEPVLVLDSKDVDKLINLYFQPGEFVFNEDTITMNDEIVYKIVTNDNKHYNVICGPGSTNVVRESSIYLRESVLKWLFDYMVKRLGVDSLVKSNYFKGYWLNKK